MIKRCKNCPKDIDGLKECLVKTLAETFEINDNQQIEQLLLSAKKVYQIILIL